MAILFGKRHKEAREIVRQASHERLRRMLRILAIVYSILIVITIYHLSTTHVVWWQVGLCVVIGLAVGFASSRMMKIDWDRDEEKVVGRIDIYGAIILVLFIIFELSRSKVVGLFADSESIGTLSLLLLAFTLYGRIIGMSKKILSTAQKHME